MSKICDMDCFNCKFDDCINDYVRPMHVITTESERISNRQSRAKRYKKLRAAGLCVDCGKPVNGSNAKCYECRLKANRKNRQAYRAKHPVPRDFFKTTGCYFCGDKCVEGKKVCARHLYICQKNAQNARGSDNFKKALSNNKINFGRFKK